MPEQEHSTILKNAGSFPKTWRWLPVVFFLSLVFAFFSSASEITVQQPSSVTPENSDAAATVPDLADIVPLQVKLVGRLKDLQKQLEVKIDDGQMEKSYAELETDLARITEKFDALIIFLIVIPSTLMIWGRYQSLDDAIHGVMSFGVNLGSNRLTVSLLIISATILCGAFLFSWLVQKLLIDQVLFQRRMEKGARISIARLAHYFIVFLGFLFAISALGLEITKITILFSALGVGIGFGLQGIVNNFVSGLVLLFEQPVRVGDLIEFDGMWAEIKHIGIRATVVRNFDSADLIIPNANLISNLVTNWTLSDRQARVKIAVGVAYGSNVALVKETLIECARDNKRVQESPSPKVFFLEFGASSLDFELRFFVPASFRIEAISELHEEIDKRFREKGITIAFPQLDMHLPGLDIGTVKDVSTLGQREDT